MMLLPHSTIRTLALAMLVSIALSGSASAQLQAKFLTVGSLHGWFANTGCEIEEGLRPNQQQNGLQWPAIYLYQDVQAAKGFWIGTTNFTDQTNTNFPYKVVHVGPRVFGSGEFYPIEFTMTSKVDPPKTYVDGDETTSGKTVDNDFVDPTIPADRIIHNVVNTAIGLTMRRTIYAFSQGFHDNYFIYEYVFTNTGNANADPAIEYPGKTLTDVVFYWQYRYAPCRDSRYVVGNSSGWGINTMNDQRGDGANPATTFFPGNADNDIRALYSWHGRHPSFTLYDNIGASVWNPPQSQFEIFSDRSDTSGRLTAPQFVGIATIHADAGPNNPTNDPGQPSTMSYEGSDDPLNFNNDQFNLGKMTQEYLQFMTRGRMAPRHADKVGPAGDPSQGHNTSSSSGGQSVAKGYGPYTIGPGDSIRIVMVEAVAGLSREKAISVGARFKNYYKNGMTTYPDGITAAQKNDSVYTGRDSLFQTFRRAIANYSSNFGAPRPPNPPKEFNVESGGDRIALSWVPDNSGPSIAGWRIYRATGRYDGRYTKIHDGDLPPTTSSFNDTAVVRGVGNFYYVVAVGNPGDNTGGGMTPAGVALTSSRYYAQTYDPAFLKRQAGSISQVRIVPNPYIASSFADRERSVLPSGAISLRFPSEPDKIAFYNIPGQCRIRIFTELGELIYTIEHTDGSGDAYWNSITSSNQVVASGVYIAVIEDTRTGEVVRKKFVIIR
jgi:hypothetical protein